MYLTGGLSYVKGIKTVLQNDIKTEQTRDKKLQPSDDSGLFMLFLRKYGWSDSTCLDKIIHRSSHPWCPIEKGVFKNFAKFTGNKLCQIA